MSDARLVSLQAATFLRYQSRSGGDDHGVTVTWTVRGDEPPVAQTLCTCIAGKNGRVCWAARAAVKLLSKRPVAQPEVVW